MTTPADDKTQQVFCGLSPDEFTFLTNILPELARRGAFELNEFSAVENIYEKLSAIASHRGDVFDVHDEDQTQQEPAEPSPSTKKNKSKRSPSTSNKGKKKEPQLKTKKKE